jgi:hypothetical protein
MRFYGNVQLSISNDLKIGVKFFALNDQNDTFSFNIMHLNVFKIPILII